MGEAKTPVYTDKCQAIKFTAVVQSCLLGQGKEKFFSHDSTLCHQLCPLICNIDVLRAAIPTMLCVANEFRLAIAQSFPFSVIQLLNHRIRLSLGFAEDFFGKKACRVGETLCFSKNVGVRIKIF